MPLINDILLGVNSYTKAIRFIKKHRMAKFFLFPLVINIALLLFGINLVGNVSSVLTSFFDGWANPNSWDFWGAELLGDSLIFMIAIIIKILFFFIFAFFGGYIVLILMSPILAVVSEKTEQFINGKEYPFSFPQMLKDVLRGIGIALRNMLIEFMAMLLLFAFSFIPVIGLLGTPILFLISSYFYGFSFMDYTCERRRLKFKESVSFIKNNRGLAIGNGAIFALVLLVPFVGVTLSGFIALISTVAATISIFEKEDKTLLNR